jgi:hypothetical protein
MAWRMAQRSAEFLYRRAGRGGLCYRYRIERSSFFDPGLDLASWPSGQLRGHPDVKALRLALIIVLCAPAFAHAALITWDYSGTCSNAVIGNCGNVGLTAGDSVSGQISADDSSVLDGILWGSELVSYWFDFGDVDIATATHTASGAMGVNSDLTFFNLLGGLIFSDTTTGAVTGSLLGHSGWVASITTTQEVCIRFVGCFDREVTKHASGPGGYDPAPQQVPEPGTLGLLGAALVVLGVVRRRRRSA